ncbi:MAG: neutral zinc metallopeptidase family protein [Candidatus Saccharibacteria bacterium]|jgi:predicted metalloprotease|nr:neutral zinc metallopeptidase family protein [Candidatus Saccharibacteria bacterium]
MADWTKILSRGNVEDRRGMGVGAGVGGAGLLGVIVYLISTFLSGGTINPDDVLNQLQSQVNQQQGQQGQFEGADQYEQFASAVLGSTNDAWRGIFERNGKTYTEPRLVLFRSVTQSGCGLASAEVGPHYCSADQTIYVDETFFDVLQQKLGAQGGDVGEAYVIAHEVGHHVQNQLGIMETVARAQQQDPGSANDLSVALELQADCFAGIWAKSVQGSGVFEPGEINEAIDAAAAVGDDRVQQKVEGQINPEKWTHGSSAQRVEWFNRGVETGSPAKCNTFS